MEKTNLIINSTVDIGDNIEIETNGKGRKFVSRFIEAGVAHYEQFGDVLITKETLDKFIQSMVGCPVIIKHKDITDENADKERVGVVSRVWFNEQDGWYYCEGIIWDKQAIDLVKNQGWNVSCTYDFESDKQPKTHNGKKVDMEFTDGDFLHLALVPNPRYERANIVINSADKAENGFITLDETDETGNRKVIWIPGNVLSQTARKRVLEVTDNYKKGDETKYDFSHTKVKPSEEQIKYLKDTVAEIEKDYKFKGIAQIEISSELNKGSLGCCYSPENTSLISLSPQLYNGKYSQERYDKGAKNGWNPKGTGDFVKSVLVHEIGHAITCNSKNTKFWEAIDGIRSDYLKNISKKDVDNPDFISNYARTNRYEFVAEAFCQGRLAKNYGKYTKAVMEQMDKYFKTEYQGKLFNASEEEETDMWVEGFGFGYPIDEEAYEEFRKKVNADRKEEVKKDNKAENALISGLETILDKHQPEKTDLPILEGLRDIFKK